MLDLNVSLPFAMFTWVHCEACSSSLMFTVEIHVSRFQYPLDEDLID